MTDHETATPRWVTHPEPYDPLLFALDEADPVAGMADHRGTTPRPWSQHAQGLSVRFCRELGDECEAVGEAEIIGMPRERAVANAALIVEAVNNYDRLLRIEAAARAYVEHFAYPEPGIDPLMDVLSAALSEPSS